MQSKESSTGRDGELSDGTPSKVDGEWLMGLEESSIAEERTSAKDEAEETHSLHKPGTN